MKNSLYKGVQSNYQYYSYLNKYSPSFLRKYQSEEYYYLGRRGAWQNLVTKFAGDHISLEEEHNTKYKTHVIYMNLTYRVAWFLFGYMLLVGFTGLGDLSQVFTTGQWDLPVYQNNDDDHHIRYESLYMVDKPLKF